MHAVAIEAARLDGRPHSGGVANAGLAGHFRPDDAANHQPGGLQPGRLYECLDRSGHHEQVAAGGRKPFGLGRRSLHRKTVPTNDSAATDPVRRGPTVRRSALWGSALRRAASNLRATSVLATSTYGQPQPYAPPQGYAPTTNYVPPQGYAPNQTFAPAINSPGLLDATDGPMPFGTIGQTVQAPTVREADLVINGFPARTGRIMLGGAVNSDAGVTGQITVDERNFDITRFPTSFQDLFSGTAFRGAGQTLRIEAAPGTDFKRYTAQFADPNLFGYLPLSMSLSGFWYDRRFRDWNEERLGGRVAFGYRITPDLSLTFGVGGQNVDIETNRTGPPELTAVAGDDNTLYNGEISLTHDTRNSPIQASRGHYFEVSFEEAFGDFDYARFEAEFRQYWLVRERADGSGKQTISYSTRFGYSGDDTPIFENFFAGGYATLRGFEFRGAGPVASNGVETGGRFQWLNTVEYMFPITADDAFRGVAFVDFGTVEEDIKIDADTFRVAPGVGVRVAIPMLGPAPLAFDFAIPVAKADGDEEQVFSFYMSLIR